MLVCIANDKGGQTLGRMVVRIATAWLPLRPIGCAVKSMLCARAVHTQKSLAFVVSVGGCKHIFVIYYYSGTVYTLLLFSPFPERWPTRQNERVHAGRRTSDKRDGEVPALGRAPGRPVAQLWQARSGRQSGRQTMPRARR